MYKYFCIAIIFIVAFIGVTHTYGLSSIIGNNPTDVGVRLPSQHSSFYAVGWYWVFYANDKSELMYSSSVNAVVWDNYFVTKLYDAKGVYFDIVFDGTYVHYICNDIWQAYEGLKYRKGIPLESGKIEWIVSEQTVLIDGSTAQDIQLAIDKCGYPWIGYMGYLSYPTIIKSKYNDGLWVTADGFPHIFFSQSCWGVIPVPITNKIYCIIYKTAGLTEEPIIGYSWYDGHGDNITTTALRNLWSGGYFGMLSVASNGTSIGLVFQSVLMDVRYIEYNGVRWSSETIIEDKLLADGTSPVITSKIGGGFTCFWLNDDGCIYMHEDYVRRISAFNHFTTLYDIQAYAQQYVSGEFVVLYQENNNIIHLVAH